MSNEVSLTIDGIQYYGWKEVSIRRSIEIFCASFDLSLSDNTGGKESFQIKPEMKCSIHIGGDTLITGLVDEVSGDIGANSHSLSIKGRCKTADLVDCSCTNKPGSWNKPISVDVLCNEVVKPYGIRIINEAGDLGEKVSNFSLDTGDTPFEVIRRICDMRSILPITNEKGDVVFTLPGSRRSVDALVYGINVERASFAYTFSDRFNRYIIKGSKSNEGDGWDRSTIQASGEAQDPEIKRFRPKIIISDRHISNKLAQNKARWEAQVRAGRSADIVVSLPQWRQSDGTLWRENMITVVDVPPLKVSKTEMIISQVTFSFGQNGMSTDLMLRRPDIYKADPSMVVQKRKKKSAAGWEGSTSTDSTNEVDTENIE